MAHAETAFTALGYAIRNGDLRTVREILEGDEYSHQLLKRADYAGNTALHLAAIGPEPLILRELLMRGASVHARNAANNTPLYLAERTGNAEGVRLLRGAGAHLWWDNDLKREGSSSSRTASRGPSPAPSPSPPPPAPAAPGEGGAVKGDGGREGAMGNAGGAGGKDGQDVGDAESAGTSGSSVGRVGHVERVGGVGDVGDGAEERVTLAERAEPSRMSWTGDEGKAVG